MEVLVGGWPATGGPRRVARCTPRRRGSPGRCTWMHRLVARCTPRRRGSPGRCTWMHRRQEHHGRSLGRAGHSGHRSQGTRQEGSGGGSSLDSPPRTATSVANLDQRMADIRPFSSREMTDWCSPLLSARSRWLSRNCSRRLRTSRPMASAPRTWSRSRRSSLKVSHDMTGACPNAVHQRLCLSLGRPTARAPRRDASTCIAENPLCPGRDTPCGLGPRTAVDPDGPTRPTTRTSRPWMPTTTTKPTRRRPRRSGPGLRASARRRWRPCNRRRRR